MEQQVAGALKAGLTFADENFYTRGNFAVHINSDGSYNLYLPFDHYIKYSEVKAVQVGKLYGSPSLKILSLKSGKYTGNESTSNGSGGSMNDEQVPAMKILMEKPIVQQLTDSGFKPRGTKHTVWETQFENTSIIVIIQGQSITGIYKAPDARDSKKLKGTWIAGYSEKSSTFGNRTESGLQVQNSLVRFNVTAGSYIAISDSEFLKDLKDVTPADLGFPMPSTKSDSSGFVISGMNATNLLNSLVTLNGLSMADISTRAAKVPACSNGDAFLMTGEDIRTPMSQDNEKVTQLGLTHQALALPLALVEAVAEGQFGDHFTLHGTKYEISHLMRPMCGSLVSPFNDGYSTSITFPQVKNLKTNESMEFSYLHPYLIHQYGFYGSHQNRSYVSPEKIVKIFDYLKR